MRRISKEFIMSIIHASAISVVNNEIVTTQLKPISTYESVTDKNALKVYKLNCTEKVENLNIIVTKIEKVRKVYAMEALDFINNDKTFEVVE